LSLGPTITRWRRLGELPSCYRLDSTVLTQDSPITYSHMVSGTWSIVIQSPDYSFTVQREFKLTVSSVNTVVVTVRFTLPAPLFPCSS
jgi:hypothetical protein